MGGIGVLMAQGLAAPLGTARQVARALEGQDSAAVAEHLDRASVQGAARRALAEAVPGPGGEQASQFLAGMAAEMALALSHPVALAEVARLRGIAPGRGGEAQRRLQPRGLAEFELALGPATAPMVLRLEPREAGPSTRWQVTAITLTAVAPQVAPGPPLRLSALR